MRRIKSSAFQFFGSCTFMYTPHQNQKNFLVLLASEQQSSLLICVALRRQLFNFSGHVLLCTLPIKIKKTSLYLLASEQQSPLLT